MNAKRKPIERKANSKGVVFALVTDGMTFEVWKLAENYSRECAGGIKKTWRYVEKGMTEEKARALFNRRVGKRDQISEYYGDRIASGNAALSR